MYTTLASIVLLVVPALGLLSMNKTGCGSEKACYFKPAGCDPNLDCTLGMVMWVAGENRLRIELVAQTLIPHVPQQYVAIGFSQDPEMGDDAVSECVMSDVGQFAGEGTEVFLSYNKGKTNDRIYLSEDEQRTLITDVASDITDGRLMCHFTQQIVPQIDNNEGRIWHLDQKLYILGATGSSQPDEVNAHDMNRGSHYYPMVSPTQVNVARLGGASFELPAPFSQRKMQEQEDMAKNRVKARNPASVETVSLLLLLLLLALL